MSDDYRVQIRGRYTEDDGWEADLGPLPPATAWYEVPLPPCPECGGDLVWFEAGYVPGTRKCLGGPIREGVYAEEGGCGSMYSVQCRDGHVVVRRERFY